MRKLLKSLRTGGYVGLAFDEAQHPREQAGSSKGGEFTSKGGSSRHVTDDEAKELVKKAADALSKDGLTAYVSKNYSDSQLRGLNTSSSNTQNWTIIDGDAKHRHMISTPKGYYDLGVSVVGPKVGIKYAERYEERHERTTFTPNKADVDRVKKRVEASMKKAGFNVVAVSPAGHDSGYGTKNVDYSVRVKK